MFLRTLGDLVLEGTSFSRPKPLLLLAYLAVEGTQDRKHLSELFWPGAANPMASLRTALTQLRQHAPEVIVGEAKLHAQVDCDVQMFLAALEQGKLSRLKEVYGGPFVRGFYLKDLGSELEEWVYLTREGLAARYREGLLRLAEGLGLGQEREAAKLAEEAYWLAGAPEAEPEVLRQVYRLLVAGGRLRARELKAEAESLGVNLDLPPTEAKTPLLLPGLPPQPSAFVGRALELSELRNLFAQEDCRLVTLLGAGGAGKTRLALRFAQETLKQGAFMDGVTFVDLTPLTVPDLLPAAVASSFGMTLPGKAPLPELMSFLRDKEALLVLDNFEQLISAAGVLSELLRHCSELRLLVTSRERLNLTAEWVYLLEGFPVPPSSDAEGLDAVTLFIQRARRSHHAFDPEGQLPHILTVCRLVHGSPLGIELAAAWVKVMTPAEIASELGQNLDLLKSDGRDGSARQGSLRATFDYSWALLATREQEALRRHAAFRGSFTQEAARQVTGSNLRALSALVDKAMLRRDSSGRYSRHPLIVQFADEKAQEHPDEASAMLSAHSAYYLDLLARGLERLEGPRVPQALALELDNLRDAWRHMVHRVTQGDEEPLNRALPLYDHLYTLMGRYGEAEAAFALAAQGLKEGTLLWARATVRQGKHHPFLGRYKTGASLLEAGLAVFRRRESQEDLAFTLRHLGFSVYHLGQYEEARHILEESLALSRALGDPQSIADSLNVLGNVIELLGDLGGAQRCHEEALGLYTRLKDYGAMTASYMALGDVAAELKDYDTAKAYFKKSYTLRLELGNQGRAAGSLARLGDVTLLENKVAEAEGLYWQALELAFEARGLPWLTEALMGLAKVFARTGQTQRAITLARGIHAQDTTRWFKERSEAVLTQLGWAAGTEAPVNEDLLELARDLLLWRSGSSGLAVPALAEEAQDDTMPA